MGSRTLIRFACVALWAGLAGAGGLSGQEPPGRAGEARAVARVSKGLLEEIVNRELAASVPYSARILGLHFQGHAEGRAVPSVEIRTTDHDATFVIHAAGTGFTWGRGVRGPVAATGPVQLSFAATTRVGFDGRKFTRLETAPWVRADFDLQRIEGRHGRWPGRFAGRLMMPVAERLVPLGERRAGPVAEHHLRGFADELADAILGTLNRTAPIEASFHRVYPNTRDWTFQLSKAAGYVQAAFGPPGSAAVSLPPNPDRVAGDAWVELWLRSTPEEAQLLRDLSASPLARALLRKYLDATVPELSAVAAEWAVAAAGSWVVISVRPEVPKTIALASAGCPGREGDRPLGGEPSSRPIFTPPSCAGKR